MLFLVIVTTILRAKPTERRQEKISATARCEHVIDGSYRQTVLGLITENVTNRFRR